MAFSALKEAVRLSIVPESPEHIAKHTWFPVDEQRLLQTNPGIGRAIERQDLQLLRYFEIGKKLKGERRQIAGERAGAVVLSPELAGKPLVIFQRSGLTYGEHNYFTVPSAYDALPVDPTVSSEEILKRVVAETAYDYVHNLNTSKVTEG